ncbi:Protein of uncharacterised function (DUF2866) [Burkholderia pseudomallei]|uniref:DUF2866 domain-containing protein n=1 Tax=Burkholderia pseudomallei TaxID=28450 RepID=UPI000F0793B6|nr:DUF2866 domain-containing protein [Burkholderia pseudomallei]VBC04250.1 Protein of uncharacterised function (DUF2866) [Burkholderia pseudomallei]
MVEDTVFSGLRTLLTHEHAFPVQSCRVSIEMQRPWGRPYRLVEWTMHLDAPARRRIVPAESTEAEIAEAVASHVHGRLYEGGAALY